MKTIEETTHLSNLEQLLLHFLFLLNDHIDILHSRLCSHPLYSLGHGGGEGAEDAVDGADAAGAHADGGGGQGVAVGLQEALIG